MLCISGTTLHIYRNIQFIMFNFVCNCDLLLTCEFVCHFYCHIGNSVIIIDMVIVLQCCHRVASPGLSTETVSGLYIRTLNRNNATDNETMHALANMLMGSSQPQSV